MDKEITRRAFAATGLVAGFTLAAGPINAAAIVTDTKGIVAGEVSVAVSDGHIPAYRAHPSAKTNWPVVLVTQEIFGVHEHIKDLCRRFAKLGYYAIAPSLYARFGDPGKYDMVHVQDLVTDIVSKVPDDEVMSDLDSAVAFAKGEHADTSKLAITGFCWGGRVVWLYAAHNHTLKAGAAWYGPLAGKREGAGAGSLCRPRQEHHRRRHRYDARGSGQGRQHRVANRRLPRRAAWLQRGLPRQLQ